jgi:hypothetical protein
LNLESIDLNRIRDEFISQCNRVGPVELWELLWVARSELHGGIYTIEPGDAVDARRLTLIFVDTLLRSGEVYVGSLTPDGSAIERWPLTPAESIARIEQEWDALGCDPDLGEHIVAVFEPVDRTATVMER